MSKKAHFYFLFTITSLSKASLEIECKVTSFILFSLNAPFFISLTESGIVTSVNLFILKVPSSITSKELGKTNFEILLLKNAAFPIILNINNRQLPHLLGLHYAATSRLKGKQLYKLNIL